MGTDWNSLDQGQQDTHDGMMNASVDAHVQGRYARDMKVMESADQDRRNVAAGMASPEARIGAMNAARTPQEAVEAMKGSQQAKSLQESLGEMERQMGSSLNVRKQYGGG